MKLAPVFLLLGALVALSQSIEESPIVLIPGILGTRLSVKDSLPNSICSTRGKFKKLWVSLYRMVLLNKCALRELPLVYNPATNSFQNNSFVEITVPDFGGLSAVDYLRTGALDLFPYFHDMIEYFVDRGYKRGKSIAAAPYDWRLAADELQKRGYFQNLKNLVEKLYKTNDNKKVTLVAHSLGGLVTLHFLTGFNGVNQAWKNKYINAFVPISGAWSGGGSVIEVLLSGYAGTPDIFSFANKLISNLFVRIARTLESIPWLLPKASVFGNQVFVSTPAKDYTASDYEALFNDIGYVNGYQHFKGVQALNPGYPAPNVPTHCYYGVGVATPIKFKYKDNFHPGISTIGLKPKVVTGDGDGSVNIESSLVCHRWSTMSGHLFKYKSFIGLGHKAIVSDKNVLKDVAKVVGAKKKKNFLERLFG